jgi:hypothetical protein
MTKAVVAILVELSPRVCVTAVVPVGREGVPVKVGLARSAFADRSTVRLPELTARGDETLVM